MSPTKLSLWRSGGYYPVAHESPNGNSDGKRAGAIINVKLQFTYEDETIINKYLETI